MGEYRRTSVLFHFEGCFLFHKVIKMIFKKTASLSGKQCLKNFEALHHRRSHSSYLKIPRCTSGLCSFYAPGVKNISARNHPPFLTPSTSVINGSVHGGVFKYRVIIQCQSCKKILINS